LTEKNICLQHVCLPVITPHLTRCQPKFSTTSTSF